MLNKLIFLLILICTVPYSALPAIKSISALKWPKVKGQLINSDIDEEIDVAGDGSRYYPNIKYKYVINGKEYFSQNYAFGFWLTNIKYFAEKIIKKYTSQKIIYVAYNPKNHAESSLLTGLQPYHVAQILLTVFVAYILCFSG